MTSTASTASTADTGAATARALRRLAAVETRLFLRDPATAFFGLAFPVLLMGVLGSIPALRERSADLHGMSTLQLYAPIMAVFSVLTLAMNGLPPVLAGYRERGVLRRLSASPVRPVLVLGALLPLYLAVSVVSLLLVGAAGLAFGVPLPRQLPGFLLAFALTVAALFALGLLVAAVAPSAKAGNAIGAMLLFPLMFFSGIWIPRAFTPGLLSRIGDLTPSGAAVQALQDTWNGHLPQGVHLVTLAVFALVAGAGAAKLFRWE
ncbi:ABC transporter permease [Kitasatospora sp. MBT63]|uniref:ABC transporter permease n=1 Tax=Kitasatospora sp. MBT63 TaxID=1444768 RepID=UPI00068D61A7|nr:ABC transporter permease [Kitasatospora sp. MBT63]